jgi:hypothetical protein
MDRWSNQEHVAIVELNFTNGQSFVQAQWAHKQKFNVHVASSKSEIKQRVDQMVPFTGRI